MTITGTLKNARKVSVGDKIVVFGNVYNDSRNRFDDGEKIKTSYVISENNNVIYTKNSTYVVEWASDKIHKWNDMELA